MVSKKLTLSEASSLPCSIEDSVLENAVQGVVPFLQRAGWKSDSKSVGSLSDKKVLSQKKK